MCVCNLNITCKRPQGSGQGVQRETNGGTWDVQEEEVMGDKEFDPWWGHPEQVFGRKTPWYDFYPFFHQYQEEVTMTSLCHTTKVCKQKKRRVRFPVLFPERKGPQYQSYLAPMLPLGSCLLNAFHMLTSAAADHLH